MTPASAALLAFDVDEALSKAALCPLLLCGQVAAARRRNRLSAFLFLQAVGRRGVMSDDPSTETLLAKFRRDALREAGVDERLVRLGGTA